MGESFDIGSVVAKITADISGFQQGLTQARDEAESFGGKLKDTADAVRGYAEQAAVVVGAQVLAFKELAQEVIGVASNFEQTQTSFGTLLGSEQKAADLMKQIMQFEQNTPFDIGTLTNAAKQMLAFGVSAQDVIPKMKELTDMSQGQSAKLTELVSIYGQVNSIQQLNGREVLRLSSIGVPIYQALEDHFKKMGGAALDAEGKVTSMGAATVNNAKMSESARVALTDRLKEENAQLTILEAKHVKAGAATATHDLQVMRLKDHIAEATTKLGTHTTSLGGLGSAAELTAAQIKDMISKGQVSSKDFEAVIQEMTSKGGLFYQENIRQMKTYSGIVSSTESQIQYAILNIMGIDIGAANEVRKGGLFDTLRTLAAGLLEWLHKLQPMLVQLGSNKTFILAIEGFVIALASLVIIIPVVLAALNPVILLVFAIEAAIVALYVAWNTNFLGIRDITLTVATIINQIFQGYIEPTIAWFVGMWQAHWGTISAVASGAMQLIKGVIEWGFGIIYALFNVFMGLITGDWNRAWKGILMAADATLQGVKDILEGGVTMIKAVGKDILDALVAPFNQAKQDIQDAVNWIKDRLDFTKRHSPSVLDIVQNGVRLVNEALTGINYAPAFTSADIGSSITAPLQQATTAGGFSGGITINLPNAIISDAASANALSEIIGNNIIKKLQQNVRF